MNEVFLQTIHGLIILQIQKKSMRNRLFFIKSFLR